MRKLVSISILVALPVCCSFGEEPAIIGSAYALGSENLLYRELHYFSDNGNDHRVVYEDTQGQVIVEKTLDYRSGNLQPAVKQNNFICGEEFAVLLGNNDDLLQLTYKENKQREAKSKSLKKLKGLVVDAGFNSLILENWDAVVGGESVKFDYLVPSRLRTYEFKLSTAECETGSGFQCFKIAPSTWYLRVLLDPILLAYDLPSRQLIEFSGLGNVADEACNYMNVDIRYQYANLNQSTHPDPSND